jgi:mRNA interferase MazF
MAKGDIVLITFPFTDLSGTKLRPSVILSEGIQDITVCFITTQTEWQEATDILLTPTNTNGLRKLSILKVGKIATLEKSLVKGILGRLTANEISALNEKINLLFQLK